MNFDEILQVATKAAEIAQAEKSKPQYEPCEPATAEQMIEWGWQYAPERGEGYEWESPWPFNCRLGFDAASWAAPVIRDEIGRRTRGELQNVAWKGHGSLCNRHINRRISRRSGYNSLLECDCWVRQMWQRVTALQEDKEKSDE